MNYQSITKFDTANGKGIRTTLWVSGCSHQCEGCHNPQTWDENSGIPFTDESMREILDSLDSPYISGLTLSGGDPLYYNNRSTISSIVSEVKSRYPDKSIWLYTGYTWEYLMEEYNKRSSLIHNILNHIDILVDGRFDIDNKDITLPYCGSTNQRVIKVKESLSSNTIKEVTIQ